MTTTPQPSPGLEKRAKAAHPWGEDANKAPGGVSGGLITATGPRGRPCGSGGLQSGHFLLTSWNPEVGYQCCTCFSHERASPTSLLGWSGAGEGENNATGPLTPAQGSGTTVYRHLGMLPTHLRKTPP